MSSEIRSKARTRYLSGFTDTDYWDNFVHRPGDVFICTPPKSGTTWMQTICGLLILGDPTAEISFPELSPWFDFRLSSKSVHERMEILNQQEHRRFVKSHSPLDGLPLIDECIYFVCYRHPLDVHFSMRKHVENMRLDSLDSLYTSNVSADFEAFLFNSEAGIGFDQPSLSSLIHHFRVTLALSDHPNVHIFHYQNLTNDLFSEMLRVAHVLDLDYSPGEFEKLVKEATFPAMKEKAHIRAPGVKGGLFESPRDFFHSGKGRKWEGILSNHEIAAYKDRMSSVLHSNDISLFEYGW